MMLNTKNSPPAVTPLERIVRQLQNDTSVLETLVVTDVADCVLDGLVLNPAAPNGATPVQYELPDVYDYIVLAVRRYRPAPYPPGITIGAEQ